MSSVHFPLGLPVDLVPSISPSRIILLFIVDYFRLFIKKFKMTVIFLMEFLEFHMEISLYIQTTDLGNIILSQGHFGEIVFPIHDIEKVMNIFFLF